MITVEVIEDAQILVPNETHKNFTSTNETLPKGTIAFGQMKTVKGIRRGEPFDYRIFVTNNNEVIYQNKIKPMATTQVYLSADNQQTATVVNVPSRKLISTTTIIGAIIGGVAGNYYAKKQGGNRNTLMVGGAILGFFVARYMEGRGMLRVKPSK